MKKATWPREAWERQGHEEEEHSGGTDGQGSGDTPGSRKRPKTSGDGSLKEAAGSKIREASRPP